jgi:hypothetical protein
MVTHADDFVIGKCCEAEIRKHRGGRGWLGSLAAVAAGPEVMCVER